MAEGNHFLNIPHQEGLFTTIKSGRSGERGDSEMEDEDDEEAEEDVRLIPRCSPIPRKRGSSIIDETAEYMRIRLVLARRVSFADASGSDLADVREFVPFDSDEEDDTWEEEEEKLRRSYQEPVYTVWPEIPVRNGDELIQCVRANKVEVESVTAVPDDQLAFDVFIRVLNVSYHKSVFVRSTLDGWMTYSECPAGYVPDSHDGDTDRFCARLTFTSPYLFSGARIDFVARFETPDGEFWANNFRKNYSATLLVSYEDTTQVTNVVEEREIRGILKPPRNRMEYVNDFSQDPDEDDFESEERPPGEAVSSCICPVVIEPEIDIEIAEAKSISSSKSTEDPNPAQSNLPSISNETQSVLVSATIQHTDHIKNISQATDSSLFSVNSISIQQFTEVRIESLDNNLITCPDKHSEDSSNSIQWSSDVTIQVPFDAGITSLTMVSIKQGMDEDQTGQENKEQTSEEDHAIDKREVDETKTLVPVLEESIKSCMYNEFVISGASKGEDFSHSIDHNISVKDFSNPLIESKMHTYHELGEHEQAGLRIESAQVCEEEVPVIETISLWEPFQVSYLEQIIEDKVTQSDLPKTSELDVSEYFEQNQKPGPELNKLVEEDIVGFNKSDQLSKYEKHFTHNTVQESLSIGSQNSFVENFGMDDTSRDTDQEDKVSVREDYKKSQEELSDICRREPLVLTHLEQRCTFEQSVSPNIKGFVGFKSEDTDKDEQIGMREDNTLSTESQILFEEKPKIDLEEPEAAIGCNTDQEEEGVVGDDYKKCPEKLSEINIFWQQPQELTHFEQSNTSKHSVPEEVLDTERTLAQEVIKYSEKREKSVPDLKRLVHFKSEDTNEEEQIGIRGDTYNQCPWEISEINICRRQPQVLTHFEESCTYEESVPLNVSEFELTPDSEVAEFPEQRGDSEPELTPEYPEQRRDSELELTPDSEVAEFPEQRGDSEPELTPDSKVAEYPEERRDTKPELTPDSEVDEYPEQREESELDLTPDSEVAEYPEPKRDTEPELTPDSEVAEYPEQRGDSEHELNKIAGFKPQSSSLSSSFSEFVSAGKHDEECKYGKAHDLFFKDLQNTPEKNEKHDAEVRREERDEPPADPQSERHQAGEDKVPDLAKTDVWRPLEVDNRQKTEDKSDSHNISCREESFASLPDFSEITSHAFMYTNLKNTLVEEPETQTLAPLVDKHLEQETQAAQSFSNLPATSYSAIPEDQDQLQQFEAKLGELDVFLKKDEIPPNAIPLPIFVFEAAATTQDFSTIVEAVSSEGEDGNSSSTQEELEDLSFNEEFEFYDEPIPHQKQEDLKSQLLLHSKTLQGSSAQCDTTLGQVLIPSLVFFSTVVCLVIGFNEPSIFLFVALFLFSLCF